MAEFVMKDLVSKAGKQEYFHIESAALHNDELGNPIHYGTQCILTSQDIAYDNHRARKFSASEAHMWDYIIGMDEANMNDLRRMVPATHRDKLYKMLEFAGEYRDVADPWYTGDFEATYDDIVAGCTGLLSHMGVL